MSKEDCGREDRCEWKELALSGHIGMKMRAEKAEAEVKQLKELCRKNHICLCTFHDYLAGKHCEICDPDRNP